MTLQALLLLSLAATNILIGVQSLGVFWPVFGLVAYKVYRRGRAYAMPGARKLRKLLGVVLVAMLISSMTNGVSRAASLAYAGMFFVYGFWLVASLGAFTPAHTARAMKIIVVSYFATVLAATLTIVLGINGFESFLFTRIWTNVVTGESRPLGFSSEPSYAAFIIVFAWMTLVRLGYLGPKVRHGFVFWTGLTLIALQLLGSIYGYLLGIVVVLTSLSLLSRPARLCWIVLATVLGCVLVWYLSAPGEESRSLRILRAITTGDLETWLSEDASSFFRFGPLFSYIVSVDFWDFRTWLGHGATSASYFFTDMFRDNIDPNIDAIELGLMPAFLYDYGLIAAALFLAFLYRATHGPKRLAMAVIFMLLIFNANFSTQMMWFAVSCALISRVSINAFPSKK